MVCQIVLSYYLKKNNLQLVITSSVQPSTFEVTSFLERHGDGVKRWAFEVDDVEKAYGYAIEHGAIPVHKPHRLESDEEGYVERAAIRIYDDSEIIYVNRDHFKGIFEPGYGSPIQDIEITCEDTGLMNIDHVVGNVREDEMNFWESIFVKRWTLRPSFILVRETFRQNIQRYCPKWLSQRTMSSKIPLMNPMRG